MITIRFGLHLDGAMTALPEGRVGHAELGPAGLLGMLELHLGLSGLQPSHAERVVQYRACLKQHNQGRRFYHASLATDELGVASELLNWRDTWYLHGWDAAAHSGFGPRLLDLAEIERSAAITVGPCAGQRLRLVLEALDRRKVPIRDIEVVEPEDALPLMWRQVLRRLPARYAGVPLPNPTGRFLDQLQARLRVGGAKDARLRWKEDGSVRVVQSDSLLLAGRWLGEAMNGAVGTRLVVAGTHAQLLDDILAGGQQARHGFSEQSAFRPSLQVLPLAMRLLWDPLDIHACLEFLTHPLCPLPRYVRGVLADKLAARPGLRPADINAELPDLEERYPGRAREVRRQIDGWLLHRRYSQATGAPLSDVLERVQQLSAFFRKRLADTEGEEGAALGAAHSQCRALEGSLTQLLAQGDVEIRPVQLAKLINQATAAGSANPVLYAELGCALATEQPGAVVRPVDHVFWWQLSAPSLPKPLPWSRSELRALTAAGVQIPTIGAQLQYMAQEWLRPILSAAQTLTLVLPPEGAELHPVWQQIACHVENLPVQRLAQLLGRPDKSLGMTKVEHRRPPARKRWWQLPAGLIEAVPAYSSSFSAMELYLNNPYQWVLKYPARLQTSRLLTLPDNFTLSGNLAHRLCERLFARPDALRLKPAQLSEWLDRNIDELVDAEGALFRMPGRRVELDRFRRQAHAAITQLVAQLRKARVTTITSEEELEGCFAGGTMKSRADLVLANELGEQGIVDMKWAGRDKYSSKLANNAPLQLIIYSELLRQREGRWPRSAYFILSEGLLLANDDSFFPEAKVIEPDTPLTPPQMWKRFEKTWAWRRDQLMAGRCEVVMEGIEADQDSTPPEDGLPIEVLNADYNDYSVLSGWEG